MSINPDQLLKPLELDDIQTLGGRIKSLRTYCDLSRPKFCKRYEISFPTLRSWEWNISTVSDKLLNRLLNAFRTEGINIDSTWLLTGTGKEPTLVVSDNQRRSHKDFHNYHPPTHAITQSIAQLITVHVEYIKDEIEVFLTNNRTAQVTTVDQDYPSLNLKHGDIVGGIKIDIHSDIPYDLIKDENQNNKDNLQGRTNNVHNNDNSRSFNDYPKSLVIGEIVIALVNCDDFNHTDQKNAHELNIPEQKNKRKAQREQTEQQVNTNKFKLCHVQKLDNTHIILAPLNMHLSTWHQHIYSINTITELYQVCWLRNLIK